jgi:PAS domain S-box-containing protein
MPIATHNGAEAAGALHAAAALQTELFNGVNFARITADARGVIQIFSAGAERMLGYKAAEVVNKLTVAELYDPDEIVARAHTLSAEFGMPVAPGFETLVFKARRGIDDTCELANVRKDGTRFPAVVSIAALQNAQDAIIGYLLIGTDDTARKRAKAERDVSELNKTEQTLQLRNADLENANRMKSEFLAKMSHELRTPLNAIIGFSELLRDGLTGPMSDEQRGLISDIFNSGKHLLSVINDILDLSKVEAGKMTLDLDSIEVSSLFTNSLSIVRERAATHRIRLSTNTGANLGSIHADVRKVKQIAYNLLSNAVKFTADGGEVKLHATTVARADVGRTSGARPSRSFPLAASEFTTFLRITVTDSGIGVSPEGLDRLFQPFSQIDTTLAREFDGTGLGLVIVKVLAELHGGTVAVESTVGAGSCFTVWLPLRVAAGVIHAAIPPAPTRAEPLGGARTALVIEDDFKAANLIRMQLESEGFSVVHAASAEAGLVLAIQQPLSLITLDIMLPNMDGWEFLRRLKRVPELRAIPVVIISITADRQKGIALGAAAVMQKPLSRRELYESLVELGLVPLGRSQSLKVLVVDDDPEAVELIALRMPDVVKTVLRAHSGREAISAAQQELPDLIVLDLLMPDVSGFDVLASLKGNPRTAAIPVLVVTGKPLTAEERQALDHGVVAILAKAELDRDRFIAEVRRATSLRHTAA